MTSLWLDRSPVPDNLHRGATQCRGGRRRCRHHRTGDGSPAGARRKAGRRHRSPHAGRRHHRQHHGESQPAAGHPALDHLPPALTPSGAPVRRRQPGRPSLAYPVLRRTRRRHPARGRPTPTHETDRGMRSAPAEFEAAKAAGLGVEWVDRLDVPFPFSGGVRLAEQVQFDPMPFLDALIAELHDRGGRLVTGRRVHAASTAGGRVRLTLHDRRGPRADRRGRPVRARYRHTDPGSRWLLRAPAPQPAPTVWRSRFPGRRRGR